jgi:uncharacterized phage-like protein YoqJ
MTRAFTVAATGHRPPRLGLGYDPESNRLLTSFAEGELATLAFTKGVSHVISGMAQGWDQAVAHAAVNLGLALICAVPFDGQESRWPPAGRERYRAILRRASEVRVISPGGYSGTKFVVRDRYMVDHADLVLALLDSKPESSGTLITVDYALRKGVPVLNGWSDWESWRAAGGVLSSKHPPGGHADGEYPRGVRQAPQPQEG